MSLALQWDTDGLHWPHRESSRFVQSDGLRWHTQQFGFPNGTQNKSLESQIPVALLIHGTGASTHSWRGLAPLLKPHFKVLAVDLPGHAFTGMPAGGPSSAQLSLPGMARAIHALLKTVGVSPALVIGHSAGAAIGVRMCLDGLISPQLVVGLNGAFLPLGGLAGQLFSPVAKLMAAAPFVPKLFSWRANDPVVLRKLIDGTGSTLDATGLALYRKLVSNPGHAAGALGMMASWDLPQLARDMPQLTTPLCLVVGSNDCTIAPRQATHVLAMLPPATRLAMSAPVTLDGLGHLAHEERPDLVAAAVLAQYRSVMAARRQSRSRACPLGV